MDEYNIVRTKEIIKLRFENKLTLKEIGNKYGLTRERIRQLLVKSVGSTGGSLKEKIELKCKNCMNSFYTYNSQKKKKYCSKKCWQEYTKKNRKCYYCETKELLTIKMHNICRNCNTKKHREYRHGKGKEIIKKLLNKYYKKNRNKQNSRAKLNRALKMGKITKPKNCEKCLLPNERLHAHHNDYKKPLEVNWYCPACHKSVHKK